MKNEQTTDEQNITVHDRAVDTAHVLCVQRGAAAGDGRSKVR